MNGDNDLQRRFSRRPARNTFGQSLMGAEWLAPKPDPRQQFMTRPAFVDQYLSDVASGRIAKRGLSQLSNVLNQATSGQPQGLLDYVGPGAMGTPFMRGMVAFHGSPHKFDKFKLSQIGTGEGAQAYGHGLYFAESPGVAKSYRTKLSGGIEGVSIKPDFGDLAVNSEVQKAIQGGLNFSIRENGFSQSFDYASDAAKILRRQANDARNSVMNELYPDYAAQNKQIAEVQEKAADLLESGKVKAIPNISEGHLYEVDIPDKYVQNFLDWDKPLSEQAEGVQKLVISNADNIGIRIDDAGQGSYSVMDAENTHLTDYAGSPEEAFKKLTGKQIYQAAVRRPMSYMTERGIHKGRESIRGGAAAHASEYLNSLGIKGIKYLDQASRDAGEGTRNLVVFDEDIIEMVGRK